MNSTNHSHEQSLVWAIIRILNEGGNMPNPVKTGVSDTIAQATRVFLTAMHDRPSVRLAVCLMPGIVFGKLTSQLGWETGATASNLLLLLGMVLFLGWKRLRTAVADGAGELTEDPALVQITNAHLTIDDLVKECGGSAEQAISVLNMEIGANPSLNATEAIAVAIRRRRMERHQKQPVR